MGLGCLLCSALVQAFQVGNPAAILVKDQSVVAVAEASNTIAKTLGIGAANLGELRELAEGGTLCGVTESHHKEVLAATGLEDCVKHCRHLSVGGLLLLTGIIIGGFAMQCNTFFKSFQNTFSRFSSVRTRTKSRPSQGLSKR